MSITKQSLAEKLIEGYVITPPTLKEQTLTKLAIQLCQYVDLKNNIICSMEQIPAHTGKFAVDIRNVWDEPVANSSNAACEYLSIPSTLKSELVFHIWLIAQELFSWNKKHQVLLCTPPELTYQFLNESDWTVEGRLNERKIACRLVQDERISVCQRYQLACVYCLELDISLLFNQIPLDEREGLYRSEIICAAGSNLVKLWTFHFAGNLYSVFGYEETFLLKGLKKAIHGGATTAFVFFWKALNEGKKQKIIVKTAMTALSISIHNSVKVRWMWNMIWTRGNCGRNIRPTYCTDILYFLYSKMHDEQKIVFLLQTIEFYETFKDAIHHCFFEVFLQWPYQNFFKSIINKLWGILHVNHFRDILLMLACNYSNESIVNKMEKENLDFEYGDLLVELLELAPDQYKRYLFQCETFCGIAELLLRLFSNPLFARRDINIIKKVLRTATVEEKYMFKRSKYGKDICIFLIRFENWVLLDSLLTECMPEDSVADFKNECLQSHWVKELCNDLIIRDSEEPFHTFLNWMFSSLEEISEFKNKLVYECDFYILATELNLDYLTKLMQRCLQCDEARTYKQKCIQKEGMDVCFSLIARSEWENMIQFLKWCFPSQDAFEEFKQQLFIKMGKKICGVLILNEELEIIEVFFRWYNLSHEVILQLKNETIFSFEFLSQIYIRLVEEDEMEIIARCLKWCLVDEESVLICKKAFDEVMLKCKSKVECYDRENNLQLLIIQRWNELIEERLRDIGVAIENAEKEFDELEDESSRCKKYKMDVK